MLNLFACIVSNPHPHQSDANSPLYRRLQKGFNLLDLLIVVAIVAITAGMGLPSLTSLLSESRAHHYLSSLSRDLIYMRSYAVNYGVDVTICPLKGAQCVNDWQRDIHIFIDKDRNRARNSDEKLLKVIDAPTKGDHFNYPRIGLTFRPDGSINGFQSGTFRYCPDTKDSVFSAGLVVNQAGRSRIKTKKIKCK